MFTSIKQRISQTKQQIGKTKQRVSNTTKAATTKVKDRIKGMKMRASHLLVKTIWRQFRKSQQPATWLKAQARLCMQRLRSWVSTVWGKHCEQVHSNAAYATALAAMVTTLAELAITNPSALAVLAAAVAVYLAVHHATNPNPYRPRNDTWGDGIDWR
jgi:hypothetical protein